MNTPHSTAHSVSPGIAAAQISVAIRMSKQSVLKALANIPPTGSTIVRGNETPTWNFGQLPECFIQELEKRAKLSAVSRAEFIASVGKPWQSPLALAEIANVCIEMAQTLRAALLPA